MAGADLASALINLSSELPSVQAFIVALAQFAGVMFIMMGVLHMSKASAGRGGGHGDEHGWKSLIFGGALYNLPLLAGAVFGSIAGDSSTTGWRALSYPVPGAGAMQPLIDALLSLVAVFGWAAIFRGVVMWRMAADGHHGGVESVAWKGAIHLLGGAACINADKTLDMMKATFF